MGQHDLLKGGKVGEGRERERERETEFDQYLTEFETEFDFDQYLTREREATCRWDSMISLKVAKSARDESERARD